MNASRSVLKIRSCSTSEISHDDDIAFEKTKAKHLSEFVMETIFFRESYR